MRARFLRALPLRPLLAGAVLLAVTVPGVQADHQLFNRNRSCPPVIIVDPQCPTPQPPIKKEDDKKLEPKVDEKVTPPTITDPSLLAALGGGVTGGEVGALGSNVGYVDSAIPMTAFRLRFDAAYNNIRPDRAEFFYAKCGCFRIAGIDPEANGPPLSESSVDYQDIRNYFEYAFSNRLSAFVELGFRFLNPEVNDNTAGLGDMNLGFKYAFLYDPCRVLTFQFRAYLPTGDSDRGLGTDHVALEPSILFYQRLGERAMLEAQLGDWIGVGGTDFQGNILLYGVGLSYYVVDQPSYRVAPVAEFVGWTLLSGMESSPEGLVRDSAGETIFNVKLGVRVGLGEATDPGVVSRHSFYAGYARALTGDFWYKDSFRLEYRLRF
jgi:hypothetical protein